MHPFPLAGAVGLAVFLVVRRRQLGKVVLGLGALVVVGLGLWGFGVVEPPNLDGADRGRREAPGQVDLPARRRARVRGDGRVHRAVAPGEITILIGGVVAGQGEISIYIADRARVGVRGRGRPDLLHARAPARPRLPRAPRPAAEDHRGAPRLRRGLLRPPRRRDDPDRALHRARARDRAVHRRRVADGAAQVPPLRRARRGPVVDAVLPARLLLLAVARPVEAYIGRGAAAFTGLVAVGVGVWFVLRAAPRRERSARRSSSQLDAQPDVAARARAG